LFVTSSLQRTNPGGQDKNLSFLAARDPALGVYPIIEILSVGLNCHMKLNRSREGRLSSHGRGLGTVTEEMVLNRAREMALINGRGPNHVLDSDLQQAWRDLVGDERLEPAPSPEETLPESERWDPVPGTPGHKLPVELPPDEQTFTEKLVEAGVADAEHEQEVEATKESLRREKT
jgi:hypothetical protein